MKRRIFAARSLVVAVGLAGCGRVQECVEFEPKNRPTGYAAGRSEGQPLVDWQRKTRALIIETLGLQSSIPPPFVAREPSGPARGLVILLHGHGGTASSIVQTGAGGGTPGLGDRLAERGWRVVAPEIRGFGGYPPGFAHHDAYLHSLSPDEYLPLVISDVLATIANEGQRWSPERVLVVGHSLGAHVTLHVGAISEAVDGVYLSGLFVPTACMNSTEHHECQHHASLQAVVGAEDLAMMLAGRRAHIFFGEDDSFYTDATRALIEVTAAYFEAGGATASLSVNIQPDCDHCFSASDLLRFVETF